ncbi:Coatomer subunit zeta-2, partial [Galemys pyrenaicus]
GAGPGGGDPRAKPRRQGRGGTRWRTRRGRGFPGRPGGRRRSARAGGRRCQREAASGMQRPEAWPRPHPGEGATAAQARDPAPPAETGEPAGRRSQCQGVCLESGADRTLPCQLQEPSLYTVKAVFILDNDGHRLLAKYYDDTFPSMKEQMVFEKNVFNKTSRTDSEIAFFGGMTIVYKSSIDLFLYVVGSSHENELMLMAVLTCLFESLNHMLRKNVEKRWLLENMDGAFLVLDEIVDGG